MQMLIMSNAIIMCDMEREGGGLAHCIRLLCIAALSSLAIIAKELQIIRIPTVSWSSTKSRTLFFSVSRLQCV